MNIRIICVGKIKDKYLVDGINMYLSRIKPYSSIEIIELNDSPIRDEKSQFEINKAIDEEGQLILKNIKSSDYVINLDLNKKEMTSEAFSLYIDEKMIQGGSSISFVIGGSYGLSKNVKERANDSISLSKMTFLHQVTRLILLEQIYRAFKIKHHETYHK